MNKLGLEVWYHLDTVLKQPVQWDALSTDIDVCGKKFKDEQNVPLGEDSDSSVERELERDSSVIV